MNNNKIIVLSGPSGVGKATLGKFLFADKELNLGLSVSATTRKMRTGEVDGREYHFISKEDFDAKIENNDFVEWNEHFSNKYGTLKSEITRLHGINKLPFLEVETFGAKNIINKLGDENVISIFVSPPSIEELKHRIRTRGTETESQIQERMVKVEEELSKVGDFDFEVKNDIAEDAANKIIKYIKESL